MHDIKWIRENPEAFDYGLHRRGLPPQASELIAMDDARIAAQKEADFLRMIDNITAKRVGLEIGRLKKEGTFEQSMIDKIRHRIYIEVLTEEKEKSDKLVEELTRKVEEIDLEIKKILESIA